MTADELKEQLLMSDIENFVDNVILGAPSPHFSIEQIEYVCRTLSAKFGAELEPEFVFVVGSAKLGYGLFEKTTRMGETLPAFRPFRPDSDIDIAIACPALFEAIWNELSVYANAQPWMPWNSRKLGDYMIYGWLRPDHFPKGARLRRCDDWWDAFSSLSADSRLGRRTIRGALYHSKDHLRRYQIRGLNQCRLTLEAQA